MEPLFFGQNGEDSILWRFFDKRPSGFFLDIGAFDGIYLSNSYFFEKQGWGGICVEPNPFFFDLCKKNRPASQCVHAAVVAKSTDNLIELWTEPSGVYSGLDRLNEARIEAIYQQRNLSLDGLKPVKVPSITVNELLSRYLSKDVEIDFVSIDVEGHELGVLAGFDLDRYRPRIIVIEANSFAHRLQIRDVLSHFDYREVRRTSENLWFVRNEPDAHRLRSIPLDCKLALVPHPLGETISEKRLSHKSESFWRRTWLGHQILFWRKLIQMRLNL